MYYFEEKLVKQGYRYIAGADEAGRGPMAGPLVAAAVILDSEKKIPGLNDSKKLTAKRRDELFLEIMNHAIEVQYVIVDSKTVDQQNVYQASKLAMEAAVKKLSQVDYCLSDAVKLDLHIPTDAIIKGDAKS